MDPRERRIRKQLSTISDEKVADVGISWIRRQQKNRLKRKRNDRRFEMKKFRILLALVLIAIPVSSAIAATYRYATTPGAETISNIDQCDKDGCKRVAVITYPGKVGWEKLKSDYQNLAILKTKEKTFYDLSPAEQTIVKAKTEIRMKNIQMAQANNESGLLYNLKYILWY